MDSTIPVPMPKKYQKSPDRMQLFIEGFQDAQAGRLGYLNREDNFKRRQGASAWNAYSDGRTAAEEYLEQTLAAGSAGHAPAHVRYAFLSYLEGYWTANDSTWEEVPISCNLDEGLPAAGDWDTQTVRYRMVYLSGWLKACTDTLPEWACDVLGSPHGSQYSAAAQLVRERVSSS